MSARDVDLEFEKAYQRLFSTSSSTAGDAGARAGSIGTSKPRAASSEIAHTVDNGSRSRSTTPSIHQVDRPKHDRNVDVGLQALSRKPSGSKQRPLPAQPGKHERPSQSRSFQSPLDALARHKAASSCKGKARAPSYLEADEAPRHLETIGRSSAAPTAVLPHSGGVPYQGSVAYYPYSPGQPSYQVAGPLVAPVPSMATVPSQTIAWTQPMMPAGAMAYPGFSASVTFSPSQFFPSPPQQVPSAAIAPPSDARSQQYTPQHDITTASTSVLRQRPEQQHDDLTATIPHSDSKAASLDAERAEFDRALKKYNREQVAQFDSKAHLKQTFAMSVLTAKDIFRANHKQKKKRETWKPLLDENGVRIPRKRGRPRKHDLSPRKRRSNANANGTTAMRVKMEAVELQPAIANTGGSASEDCLPVEADRGRPVDLETHTLFVDPDRRLRWLVRWAITQAGARAGIQHETAPSEMGSGRWARWSTSLAARMQKLNSIGTTTIEAPTASIETSASADPAGLFPRDKRRQYVALRKDIHTATRTATSRVCMPRLVRYLAKTAAATAGMASDQAKQAYLQRKHRAAKLTRYTLKFARPAALDVRRLWSVWARAAHARSSGKARNADAGPARTVSFAKEQPASPAPADDTGFRVKLEPESPSVQRAQLSSASAKQEPDSDGIVTPALPGTPILGARSIHAGRRQGAISSGVGREGSGRPPPFLRRNFRVYRLAGLSDLPLPL